jgi:hypothetical protein
MVTTSKTIDEPSWTSAQVYTKLIGKVPSLMIGGASQTEESFCNQIRFNSRPDAFQCDTTLEHQSRHDVRDRDLLTEA